MTIQKESMMVQLGDLFNSFRKDKDKSEAISKVWKTFSSVKDINVDALTDTQFDFLGVAKQIGISFGRNMVTQGLAGANEVAVGGNLFEAVLENVLGLFKESPPETGFFPGEWVAIHTGDVDDPLEDMVYRDSMFGSEMDMEEKIPNYDVGFYINHSTDDMSVVFDCRKGTVTRVHTTELRSVPNQDSLDGNSFLADLKSLYFQKKGPSALSTNKDMIEIGKEVLFNGSLASVLEFEPVKKAVHLINSAGQIVETTVNEIRGVDQEHQLTWLGKQGNSGFPTTIMQYGFCWYMPDGDETLCCVKSINSGVVDVYFCTTALRKVVDDTMLRPVSEKLAELFTKLPEFRRFKTDLIYNRTPPRIWNYRHLCTESTEHREVDKVDRTGIDTRYKNEIKNYGVVDPDLQAKLEEFEVAYNEKGKVEYSERDRKYKIVPARD